MNPVLTQLTTGVVTIMILLFAIDLGLTGFRHGQRFRPVLSGWGLRMVRRGIGRPVAWAGRLIAGDPPPRQNRHGNRNHP